MLRCDVSPVMFEDGIIRHVFVVWLLEETTGREPRVAMIRGRIRPVVVPWPNPNLPPTATPSSPPDARTPSVKPPPPELRPGFPPTSCPVTSAAEAAANAWRANEAWTSNSGRRNFKRTHRSSQSGSETLFVY